MIVRRAFESVFRGRKRSAAADPRAALEAAYWRQVAAVQTAQRGIDDVLAGERRLELEAQSLQVVSERPTNRGALATRQLVQLRSNIDLVRAQRLALENQTSVLREQLDVFRRQMLALNVRIAIERTQHR